MGFKETKNKLAAKFGAFKEGQSKRRKERIAALETKVKQRRKEVKARQQEIRLKAQEKKLKKEAFNASLPGRALKKAGQALDKVPKSKGSGLELTSSDDFNGKKGGGIDLI